MSEISTLTIFVYIYLTTEIFGRSFEFHKISILYEVERINTYLHHKPGLTETAENMTRKNEN